PYRSTALPPYRSPDPLKYRIPHRPGKLAGVGVLSAWVERGDEQGAVRHPALPVVAEPRPLSGREPLPPAGCAEPGLPRDAAQGQHDPGGLEQSQLSLEVRPAALELHPGRLVARRRAVSRRRDVAVGQHHPVAPSQRVRLAGPAVAVQRLIEPAPAAVTGEQLPGPVGAVRCRRQADDEQSALRIAEARDRPAPVLLPSELPLLHLCDG